MELFWVNDVLAVATRPRGGDWLRDDLAEGLGRGVQILVSCLTREEESDLGLDGELEAAQSLGKVGIYCRQALGRSPLVAAAVLVQRGMTATAAWETVARARGRAVPETEEQRLWLVGFATRQPKRLTD
jgi:hypothetical protein